MPWSHPARKKSPTSRVRLGADALVEPERRAAWSPLRAQRDRAQLPGFDADEGRAAGAPHRKLADYTERQLPPELARALRRRAGRALGGFGRSGGPQRDFDVAGGGGRRAHGVEQQPELAAVL